MTDFIEKIAKIEKKERFNAIVQVLKENEIDYEIQNIPGFKEALGNIIVNFNKGKGNKVVFSAHYDNCNYTPGANDNGAACSILLNLIIETKKNGAKRCIEFVFFDLEEGGFLGSRQYLKKNTTPIDTIFNMDMCGMGTNICVHTEYLSKEMKEKYTEPFKDEIILVKLLPAGDAYTFMNEKIPTVYVINSTDNDLQFFKTYYKFERYSAENLDFIKTMHKPSDTPDTVNLNQVEKIEKYLLGCIENS